jgi:hypothetical protein
MECVMVGSALPALLAFIVARRYVTRHPHTEEVFATA